MTEIHSNDDLRQAVKQAIDDSGYKKAFIAKKLGISRQAFSNFLSKSNFSIDDAQKILDIIGYDIISIVHKIIKKN